jgi:hypothetical protein
MKKFFLLSIALLAFSAGTFAQVSQTATATAAIVSPIAIAKVTDMNFGRIASSAVAGTVSLPAAAAPVRTVIGGCTLQGGGTVSSASFTVTGQAGFTYSISLPADGTVSLTGPVPAMAANTFISSPTVAAGGLLTGGTETLYVGATLSVAANQPAGAYTSANFTVTVNYN